MKKKKISLFLMIGLLVMTFMLPMAEAMRKPDWALDDEDLEGWWIDTEDGMEMDLGMMKLTIWWQIWMNASTWAAAGAAMSVIIEDMGDSIDVSSIWDEFLMELIGWIPSPVVIPGFDDAVIWDEGGAWYGMACYAGKIVVVGGTDAQGAPEFPFLSMVKTPTSGAATYEDVEDLLTSQGTIIALGAGIPGFEILTVFFTLAILTGVFIFLRKDQLSLLQTN